MHDGAVGSDSVDAPPDAMPLGPWGAPSPIPITPVGDDDPTATADLLELYFNRADDIYVITRASVSDPWSDPTPVDELNSADVETTPEVSPDGLTIYFASGRMPTLGGNDIWMATRASRTAAWGTPVQVSALSSTAADGAPVQIDELSILIDSDREGSLDIFLASRASAADAWGTPVVIGELVSAENEGNPMLSSDKLTIYFDSNRSGNNELYAATRSSPAEAFGAPAPIAELNSTSADSDPWVSPDGRTMYFTSSRDGTQRLWQTTR